MSKVLPHKERDSIIVHANTKWDALAQAGKAFYDGNMDADQMQAADKLDREVYDAWWEEFLCSTYTIFNSETAHSGGWMMAEPLNIENVWRVYLF